MGWLFFAVGKLKFRNPALVFFLFLFFFSDSFTAGTAAHSAQHVCEDLMFAGGDDGI